MTDIFRLIEEEGELSENVEKIRLKIMSAVIAGESKVVPMLQMAAIQLESARDNRRDLIRRARRAPS